MKALKSYLKYAFVAVIWWQMVNIAAQGENAPIVRWLLKWLEG